MKWTIELAIAVAVTAAIWALFRNVFPTHPLDAADTVLVLAVVYGLVKGVQLLRARRHRDGARRGSGAES